MPQTGRFSNDIHAPFFIFDTSPHLPAHREIHPRITECYHLFVYINEHVMKPGMFSSIILIIGGWVFGHAAMLFPMIAAEAVRQHPAGEVRSLRTWR